MLKFLKAISWLWAGLCVYGLLRDDYAQATFDLLMLMGTQRDIEKLEAKKAKKTERVG